MKSPLNLMPSPMVPSCAGFFGAASGSSASAAASAAAAVARPRRWPWPPQWSYYIYSDILHTVVIHTIHVYVCIYIYIHSNTHIYIYMCSKNRGTTGKHPSWTSAHHNQQVRFLAARLEPSMYGRLLWYTQPCWINGITIPTLYKATTSTVNASS